jgi:mycofactocin precursor
MEDRSVVNKKEVKEDANQEKEDTMAMEEFEIEELAVDGICGVY